VLPLSIGTALSLVGDSSLYALLATHTAEAGIALSSVGLMLSANRWIRLPLNPIVGLVIERIRRRKLFLPALFLGAFSTLLYALNLGSTLFLVARLLWGIAWVGIWLTGNTIVLDASPPESRGRWLGIYQVAFFLGMSMGSVLGGWFTDLYGFSTAMMIHAGITLFGALISWIFLPETRDWQPEQPDRAESEVSKPVNPVGSRRLRLAQMLTAAGVLAASRLTVAGLLSFTLGLYLQEASGGQFVFANRVIGLATLTGLSLGLTTLVSMLTALWSGRLSDRIGRWRTVALFLLPGAAGFVALTLATPLWIALGLIGIALSAGSSTILPTAIMGDQSRPQHRGRWLGRLYTIGDLASAAGPPLFIALLPLYAITDFYLVAAIVLGLMSVAAIFWGLKRDAPGTSEL
jgi:MFS family permease